MKVKQQKYEMIAQKPHCENFIPIQTKDFHCLNSDNLRKQNLSNGRFSLTAYQTARCCSSKIRLKKCLSSQLIEVAKKSLRNTIYD